MATVHFNEEQKRVPTIDFDYGALDPVGEETRDGDRDVLRAALSLVATPGCESKAAARAALLYSVMHPYLRTGEILQLFPGVRRNRLTEARIDMACLLDPDEPKAKAPLGVEKEAA